MHAVYEAIDKVATTDATVFLYGESGTGKELVAQAIHNLSKRRQRPFLALNCGGIAENVIGTELFGHERGSFTGASKQHKGYFERAAGGTLFLDEVTEMPPELQVHLLRVLETGTLLRVGGDREVKINVRVIAATNRDPESAIAEGKLRQDLMFRLMVFPIHLPPLRERQGDVELLSEHFLADFNREQGTRKRFSLGAKQHLVRHMWPGNVRELRNTVHRAFILAEDELLPDHFPIWLNSTPINGSKSLKVGVGTPIDEVERRLIIATLDHFDGDKKLAAEALGISLKTLYDRLKQYDK